MNFLAYIITLAQHQVLVYQGFMRLDLHRQHEWDPIVFTIQYQQPKEHSICTFGCPKCHLTMFAPRQIFLYILILLHRSIRM